MAMTSPVCNEPMSEETREVSDEPPLRGLSENAVLSGSYPTASVFSLKKLFLKTTDAERNISHRPFFVYPDIFRQHEVELCA